MQPQIMILLPIASNIAEIIRMSHQAGPIKLLNFNRVILHIEIRVFQKEIEYEQISIWNENNFIMITDDERLEKI
jgi:hypothetical protein